MKLVVGLGNIGDKYTNSRHNIGFNVVDKMVSTINSNFKFSNFENCGFLLKVSGKDVIFLKPSLFMNNSGVAVRKVKDYYKIQPNDILIITDDCSLDLGRIRLRENGSDGGHNGLKSIIAHLNSQNFARLKIGIGNNKDLDLSDFVLGKFSKTEMVALDKVLETASEAVSVWIESGSEKVMQQFNGLNCLS
jgi:PTH1 family peptidyl-tRNA hydrolase